MATKTELEEELNESLGTSLNWSDMKKSDLEHFKMLVDEGLLMEKMAKHLAKTKGSEKYEEAVEEWQPGKLLTQVL